MWFGGIVCPNEARLILLRRVFRLRKRKAPTSAHALHCTDFLDRFLEPVNRQKSKFVSK